MLHVAVAAAIGCASVATLSPHEPAPECAQVSVDIGSVYEEPIVSATPVFSAAPVELRAQPLNFPDVNWEALLPKIQADETSAPLTNDCVVQSWMPQPEAAPSGEPDEIEPTYDFVSVRRKPGGGASSAGTALASGNGRGTTSGTGSGEQGQDGSGNGSPGQRGSVVGRASPPAQRGSGIRPPVARRIIRAAYPADAERAGAEGTVVLKVEILASGSVGSVAVVRSAGRASLDNAACQAYREGLFDPATSDGLAVRCEVTVPVVFQVQYSR